MYMITYEVVKTKGVEGTYDGLEEAKNRLRVLQQRYTGTKFEVRKMKNNNLYEYVNGGEIHNG